MSVKRFDWSNQIDISNYKRFDGSNWIDVKSVKRFDGSNWIHAYSLPATFRFEFTNMSSYKLERMSNTRVRITVVPLYLADKSITAQVRLICNTNCVVGSNISISLKVLANSSDKGEMYVLYNTTTGPGYFAYTANTESSTTYQKTITVEGPMLFNQSIKVATLTTLTYEFEIPYFFMNYTTYIQSGSTREVFDLDNVTNKTTVGISGV